MAIDWKNVSQNDVSRDGAASDDTVYTVPASKAILVKQFRIFSVDDLGTPGFIVKVGGTNFFQAGVTASYGIDLCAEVAGQNGASGAEPANMNNLIVTAAQVIAIEYTGGFGDDQTIRWFMSFFERDV